MMSPFRIGQPYGPLAFIPREVAPGETVWEYVVDPAHFNPNGVLHGGVVMALLDTAMGHAIGAAVVPKGSINAAAQMNVNFLEPIRSGTLRARGRAVRIGKRMAVAQGEATDDRGTLVATATSTHAILKLTPVP
jgi:uncharacterized protein (TIGR00369 family)